MKNRSFAIFLAFLALVCIGNLRTANASLLVGTGGSITAPALSGGTLVNFDAGPTGIFTTLVFGDLTVTGVDAPFTLGPDYNGQYNTRGTYSVYNDFDYVPTSFRFDFAAPVQAFGFNWGAADGGQWVLSAFDSGGALIESHSVASTWDSNAGDYIGIAANNIAYATISETTNYGDYVFVDEFVYVTGGGGAVPEPASVAVWSLLAVVGLGYGLRRNRRK
jgi:hypothetical protein